jgi:threonyl-tRNA synthetase
MPIITFPDGKQSSYNSGISLLDIALDLNPFLAKNCIAGHVNGTLVDATDLITEDAHINIITPENDDSASDIVCRSSTCLLGHAIKQLWPDAKMVSAKTTGNSFYYDIDINRTLGRKEIDALEYRMKQLAKTAYNIAKKRVSWQQAHDLFSQEGELYKVSFLDEKVSKDTILNLYHYGEYIDSCDSPHVSNVNFCLNLKIWSAKEVHWLGKKSNKLLQRIFGEVWTSEKQLGVAMQKMEDIEKRDHRKIGQKLGLYHMQEEAPGMVFWHQDGLTIFQELENFLRSKLKEYSYQEVKSVLMMDRILWEKTGHWDHYKDSMFTVSSENREYCIKPMNCPGHIQIFNQGLKSYRDLPLRLAEFGCCHRNEPSGSLHGLMRVRGFTQDDAHIFCTEEQVRDEVCGCIRMIYDVYHTFGFKKISVKLSTRPEKRVGDDMVWDRAERDLELVLTEHQIPFEIQPGEGAFYGPKIEFTLYDCLGRSWQCGTVQLDFFLTRSLKASYIDENSNRRTPILIHRAILGSIERFIGILIEEYSGNLPSWLAPIQAIVINITKNQEDYVEEIAKKISDNGFRVKADLRKEKIGLKIREHTMLRIPYILICGDKELQSRTVSVRTRSGENVGDMSIDVFIEKLQRETLNRSIN